MLAKAIKETNLNSFNNFNVFQSPKMPLDTGETSKNNIDYRSRTLRLVQIISIFVSYHRKDKAVLIVHQQQLRRCFMMTRLKSSSSEVKANRAMV